MICDSATGARFATVIDDLYAGTLDEAAWDRAMLGLADMVRASGARKVDTGGTISTVAGNGKYGFSGDGGAATQASLSDPTGVAVDGAGNLYIVDRGNQRIRKVDTTGRISTVAGTGAPMASR
jgi:hypothetical protein